MTVSPERFRPLLQSGWGRFAPSWGLSAFRATESPRRTIRPRKFVIQNRSGRSGLKAPLLRASVNRKPFPPRKTKPGTKESAGFSGSLSFACVPCLPPSGPQAAGGLCCRIYSGTTRFSANALPFWPGTSSYSIFCPSVRVVRPACSTAEIWTKASLDPSSGSIKP